MVSLQIYYLCKTYNNMYQRHNTSQGVFSEGYLTGKERAVENWGGFKSLKQYLQQEKRFG